MKYMKIVVILFLLFIGNMSYSQTVDKTETKVTEYIIISAYDDDYLDAENSVVLQIKK